MNKLKTFFQTIIKSSTSPAYYNHVVAAPMGFSWKYFFALNFVVMLLVGLQLIVPIALFDAVTNTRSLATVFPSDLVITGDQEGLHVNQELPYSVRFPSEMAEGEMDADVPVNAVTFTSDEVIDGLDSVKAYDSLFVLTPSTAYVVNADDNEEVRMYPIPEFEQTVVVDRSTIDSLITKIVEHPFIKYKLYLPAIFVFVVAVAYPFVLVFRLITLAFFSAIAWALAKMFMSAKKLSYGNIFQISIHSITPVMLIWNLLGFFSLVFLNGGLYLLGYLAWTLYVISQLKKSSRVVEGEIVSRPSTAAAKTRKSKTGSRSKK